MSAETTPTSVTAGEVVPLGDHLCAHQKVQRAAPESREDYSHSPTAPHRVAIDPPDAASEQPLDLVLDPLGAEIRPAPDMAPRTSRTRVGTRTE